MKRWLNAWLAHTRVERIGFASLTILLIILILIRTTMSLWSHAPIIDRAEAVRLNQAWEAYLRQQDSVEIQPTDAPSDGTTLFTFDPNTLDSEGFIRLGIPPRAVKGLLNWRRHGKHFYKPEDLKPLYNLPPETYTTLLPYIQIAGDPHTHSRPTYYDSRPPIPAIIDLNTADSALLDRGINGIGATLAHKIIQRRQALGGFVRHEQLLEIYRFADTTYNRLRERLTINTANLKRMNLNTVNLSQLSNHPYIGEKTGKNILMYRDGIKRYERIEQLREVPLMNEEIYRKIAPYFTVE